MATPALNPLVEKIRAKYPGAYDDMDDATLTKAVLAKYPQYSDLAAPAVQKPTVNMQQGGGAVGAAATSFGTQLSNLPRNMWEGSFFGEIGNPRVKAAHEQRIAAMNAPGMEGVKNTFQAANPVVSDESGIDVGATMANLLPYAAAARGVRVPGREDVASALRTASNMGNPDILGSVSPRVVHLQKLAGRLASVIQRPPDPTPSAPVTDLAAGLGQIKVTKTGPPTTSLGDLKNFTMPKPADVQAAANQAVGYEPPKPGTPIGQQGWPPGHTPVESSAVRSFKYDPDARELEVHPTSGSTTYRYGDVSPEQAQAFQSAKSVGKAWQDIRQSGSPLVAKRVNGKWVGVKPVQPTPALGDLTDILQQSLAQARQK